MRRAWAVLAFGGLLLPGSAAGDEARLFVPRGGEAELAVPHGVGVVRARAVAFDAAALPGADGVRPLPPAGHTLLLDLFDDVTLRARLVRAERIERGMTWVGRLEGRPLSDVVLAVYDGVLTGSVTWPDASYRIAVAGGVSIVQQLDHSLFPEDGCFKEVPGGTPDVATGPLAQADDGSTIDVLVVYTAAARAAAGSPSAMQSLVATAIAETNTGYANSGVIPRVRLASAQEIGYAESGTTVDDMSNDLERVTGTSDGFMDTVHALRNTYKADLVSLLVTGYNNANGACGIAWLMSGNNPGFAPNAFSVVDISCATGYFSFGHEMGHNMGLNHARTDPVGAGAFPYSYGYKWTGYRTVMAYAPGTRILHFSNPNVQYLGNPTGVSETSPSAAHNALSLNNTRVTVANWRVGAPPTPPPARPPDLMLLARSGTASGATEAHVLDGTSGFQAWRLNVATVLSQTGMGPDWWFLRGDHNRDGKEDLYVIKKAATGTGRTELHVLNGASAYQGWLANVATALGETGSDAAWVFALTDHNGDGFQDLYAIGKDRTGSDRTEVHVLSGATGFQTWLLNVATPLPEVGSDGGWMFLLGDYNRDGKKDLYAIARARPASTHTEVHVLGGANGFQSYLANIATPLPKTGTDVSWMFVLGDYNGDGAQDLYSILKTGTGSGKTEVHVLNGANGFQTYLANIATVQGPLGSDWSMFFVP